LPALRFAPCGLWHGELGFMAPDSPTEVGSGDSRDKLIR
jgi:hypothetical protein